MNPGGQPRCKIEFWVGRRVWEDTQLLDRSRMSRELYQRYYPLDLCCVLSLFLVPTVYGLFKTLDMPRFLSRKKT